MDDYLTKPLKKEALARMLEKWVMHDDCKETHILFNWPEMLDNFDGDHDFAHSILDEALKSIPEDIETLKELCKGVDTHTIRRQAHTLKGIAANISTPALREAALSVEKAAKDGMLDSVLELLPEVERTALLTIEEIETVRKSNHLEPEDAVRRDLLQVDYSAATG